MVDENSLWRGTHIDSTMSRMCDKSHGCGDGDSTNELELELEFELAATFTDGPGPFSVVTSIEASFTEGPVTEASFTVTLTEASFTVVLAEAFTPESLL